MDKSLFENTKVAAYFLWEHTQNSNALNLWYCAEDIACYLEQEDILTRAALTAIMRASVYDLGYISFVRPIAFRIYVYTNCDDSLSNWYAAERLLNNEEWCEALTSMADYYRSEKNNSGMISEVRSDQVRNYYESKDLI